MNLNDLFTEEKVRLDPKCWTGKKIGNPKTKMKGGTRVNNCVPAESVNEMDKSQTPPGRDGSNDLDAGKKEYTAKATTAKKVAKDAEKILNKELNKKQGVAEGLAQDEAEEDSGWRAEFVNEINYNTFEVKLTNTRSKESANFIVRPVDMVSYGPTLSIETMDVHDLQTGQTESWTNDDPAPDGPIAYAISGLFYDNKELQKKLQNIIDTHDTKGQNMMPGLEKRRSIGQEVDTDAYIDSQEKTQAAMAKMKKGVAEKLGDNRPKLGSKRDSGKSIRKWRSARGLDETGVAEGELDEGWKSALGAAAMAGTMALGSTGANARVTPDGQGGFTGGFKPSATVTAPADNKPAAEAPKGFSKEYLQSVVNGTHPRPLISKERAQELLQQQTTNEQSKQQKGADYRDPPEANYGDDYQDMVARVKKLAGLGPLKTVYDPQKRVYRNVPTAVQPKK